jgi:hypothetical protein
MADMQRNCQKVYISELYAKLIYMFERSVWSPGPSDSRAPHAAESVHRQTESCRAPWQRQRLEERSQDILTPSLPTPSISLLTRRQRRGVVLELDAIKLRVPQGVSSMVAPELMFSSAPTMSRTWGPRPWVDLDTAAGTLAVTGQLVRISGEGLKRLDTGKTASSRRTVPLPEFAQTLLGERRSRAFWGEHPMIFPSSAATWRDPDNFNKQWRKVRDELGVPEVTSHSFRKSMADLIDGDGLSARFGADQLGHTKISMTRDKSMSRGAVHAEVAALLDRTTNDE